MESLSIYDIKRLTADTAPYFFSSKTMRFFGQTLKDFRVHKQNNGKYLIIAENIHGVTKRLFNPINNELEHITE